MADQGLIEIDLDAIVRNRMGAKARYVPRFVVGWLKRLIHQDFINGFLRQGYEGVDFCEKCIEYLGAEVATEGMEHLPDDGRRYTFVCNHPLGAVDGISLGAIIGRHYDGHIKYLVNDLLMNLKGLAPLCVPINKLGRQARNLPKMIDAAFESDDHVIIFPAGLCSRQVNGQIHDIPWSKAFVTKSIQTRRDVIPVHFIGQNSPRFYRIARLFEPLRSKFNVAMLFLPDEMYKTRGKHYTVRFGTPIPWQTFDDSRSKSQWAQWVEEQVYKL